MPNISRFLFFPLSLSVCLAAKTIYRRTLRTYEISNTAIKLKMNNKRNKFSFTNASTSRPICCCIESRECEKVTCSLDCAENTEYGERQKGERVNGGRMRESVSEGSEVGNKMNIRNTHRHTQYKLTSNIFLFIYKLAV